MVLGDVRQGSHQGEQKAVKMLQLVNGGESSLRKAPQASQSRSHGRGGGGHPAGQKHQLGHEAAGRGNSRGKGRGPDVKVGAKAMALQTRWSRALRGGVGAGFQAQGV